MAKVLVVDAGGRGNAIAHAFARSEKVKKVFVAPGNAGSEFFKKCSQAKLGGKFISSIRALDEILRFAKLEDVDMVFVGPEEPLSLGIVDLMEESGIPTVGPRKDAAILEASKCWTKDFLARIGVPIPEYSNFDDPEEAKEYIMDCYSSGKKLVVKADGLAAGKGVYVCDSEEQAMQAVDEIMVKKKFGQAGDRVEIEERLYGIEVAFTAISDGKTVKLFGHAKDYKRAFDSDDIEGMREFYIGITKKFISKSDAEQLYREGKLLNPNTGGMGAVSPHPALTPELEEKIMKMIVRPVITSASLEGRAFKGILYPVIMLVQENGELIPKVLEINIRECDPGAQAKLPRLETDMYDISMAVLERELDEIDVRFSSDCCIAVCAVSGALKGREGFKPGYPAQHYTSQPMKGVKEAMKETILYANGIARPDGYQTTGGRVITVVGRGKSLEEARSKAYSAIEKIKFPGMRYRKTIGLDMPE